MTIQTREEVTVSRGDGGEQAERTRAAAEVNVPADVQAKAEQFIDRYVRRLESQTEAHTHEVMRARDEGEMRAREERESGTEAATPVLLSGYQYWNCLTVGPIQFFGNPPYRPAKIIAAGEFTLMLGVVWINPVNSDGGGLPGTVVLGNRDYRVSFETIDLTNVVDGPDGLFGGTFASPASVVNVFPWWLIPADPGPKPKLYETTLTADIVQAGQPMAAFSTWHLDLDSEPAFLGRPAQGPEWQYDQPARFLVYRQ